MARFFSLDLELNQLQPAKIIEIGVAVGEDGKILDTLSIFVNPQEKLLPRITELTTITQEQVDSGLSLPNAYKVLKQFILKHQPAMLNPVVWGGGDCEALRSELGLEAENFVFGRRYFDAKTLYQTHRIACGLPWPGGLKKSMQRLGLKFRGTPHRAVDDAINTYLVFHHLLEKLK
jgi:inhibitor of KinA sporulation pathway (predicted exonuclease)